MIISKNIILKFFSILLVKTLARAYSALRECSHKSDHPDDLEMSSSSIYMEDIL